MDHNPDADASRVCIGFAKHRGSGDVADEASVIGDKVYITREDGHVVTCRVVGPTIAIPGSNKREMADFDTVFCPSQVCVVYDGRMTCGNPYK